MNALYDTIGKGYRNYRQPDPRIAAQIQTALGDAQTIVNVGAGCGSYEPRSRAVTGIEPSAEMIAQRPADAGPCLQGTAEALPFDDNSFDAALAILTVHHWSDQQRGLAEMKRVARKRCVFLTWEEPETEFWLTRDYFPEILGHDRAAFSQAPFRAVFGAFESRVVPIPHDCTDGFLAAYWKRPQIYLDPDARRAISSFSYLDGVEARIAGLKRDLEEGRWEQRNASLRDESAMDFGYRIIIAELGD